MSMNNDLVHFIQLETAYTLHFPLSIFLVSLPIALRRYFLTCTFGYLEL